MKSFIWVLAGLFLFGFETDDVLAQRGTGQNNGLARSGFVAEDVTLSGTVTEINTGPCASTTGWSPAGTHVVIKTKEQGNLDIHLGPAGAVDDLVDRIKVGDDITVLAFRTPQLAENAYIARIVDAGGYKVTLRDETLRPVWAGSRGRGAGYNQGYGNANGGRRGGGRRGGGYGPYGAW